MKFRCWRSFFLLICGSFALSASSTICDRLHNITEPIVSIFCAAEHHLWVNTSVSTVVQTAGCLLGPKKRCDSILLIPTINQIQPSRRAPKSENKQYHSLALIAEKVVPVTWWRRGFSNDLLLLSHNDSDFPRKLLDARQRSNIKTKNIHHWGSRQLFLRNSTDFHEHSSVNASCAALESHAVLSFRKHWIAVINASLGGGGDHRQAVTKDSGAAHRLKGHAFSNELGLLAQKSMDVFIDMYGSSEQRLYADMVSSIECRGALAATALVLAVDIFGDLVGGNGTFSGNQLLRGYMLASLGRHLLHGDSSSTGDVPTTSWVVRGVDFVALQSAYMHLYTDSFGAEYTRQLDKHIPLAFPPSFEVHSKPQWRHLAQSLEPVYSHLRNWMYTESGNLVDFGPYIPLVSFEEVRRSVTAAKCRRVLVDVGANGFFGSPKYLLDSYAPYLPFTHAIMIDPEPHFSATVPKAYSERYNISFQQIYAEVGTGSDTDMLRLLPTLVTKEDFVVLKFDVDSNSKGVTMEWGFLFSLMQSPHIAELVDELYIELHFHFPSLHWQHHHSNWEALDAMRYLRSKGAIVHGWP